MVSPKITILFDANPLVNGSKSGVGYYTYGLIKALSNAYPDELILIGHYFNFMGRKKSLDLPLAPNITYLQSNLLPGKVISICRHLGFQPPIELFFRKHVDFALYPNFISLPSLRSIPSAIVLHDLCYLEQPQYVSQKNVTFLRKFVPSSIRRSKLIISVSDFTRQAALKHYNAGEKTFVVTHIPPGAPRPGPQRLLQGMNIKTKYILYVGNLEPRKNIRGLVDAYSLLPDAIRATYSLVLAGGKGWYIDQDLAHVKQLQEAGLQILLPGYITDDQKAALYRHASLCVMPSYYEGFGMPILEAMSYGTPTAIGDIPVFHEVAGEASVYFNPHEPRSIAEVIQNVLHRNDLRKQLSKKGLERAQSYNWDKVAAQVYGAISKAIKNS